MAWRTCSHSRRQIDDAGVLLAAGPPSPESKNYFVELRRYREAFQIMDDWRASHAFPLNTIQVALRRRVRDNVSGDVFQRLKRASSVTGKLERFPAMRLSRVQDLGGCRAILHTVSDVDEIREVYRNSRDRHRLLTEKDYIRAPKCSGYRGRHLVYQYISDRKPTYNGHRVEIQLRTRLQHYWATAVEVAGLYVKSPLKSGSGPEDWLEFFKLASSLIADREGYPRLAAHEEALNLKHQLAQAEEKISACASLRTFSQSHHTIQHHGPSGARYFLIEVNYEDFTSQVSAFTSSIEATNYYSQREVEIARDSLPIDAVLVSAKDVDSLARGYPNYFLDTDEFVSLVDSFRH